MQQTEFARVTSLLAKARGQEEVATALGVQPQTYRQMRAQPGERHYRRPPTNWRARLRPLAELAAIWYRTNAADVEASVLEDFGSGPRVVPDTGTGSGGGIAGRP